MGTRDTDKYLNATAEKVAPAPFTFMIASCILLFIDLAAFDFDPREEAEMLLTLSCLSQRGTHSATLYTSFVSQIEIAKNREEPSV